MSSTSSPSNQRNKKSFSWTRLVLLVVLVALGGFIALNQQLIRDYISYVQFTPTSKVSTVADSSGLSGYGRFLLYATHPQIDDRTSFNQECDRREQGVAILGCYANNRTYVFDITDERLQGIKEVTMAHEMLHAAYVRLSNGDKNRIDDLLNTEYQKLKDDPAFASRMAFYDRTEPGERLNELHSIIGTEVANVSPELESYYTKYFDDRSVVVKLNSNYEKVFDDLKKQADDLSSQLDLLTKVIESTKNEYLAEIDSLNADIKSFNARANSGYYTSQSAFNMDRNRLVARISQLNSQKDAINSKVAEFNTLVKQYNDAAVKTNDLYQSIDSSVPAPPKV